MKTTRVWRLLVKLSDDMSSIRATIVSVPCPNVLCRVRYNIYCKVFFQILACLFLCSSAVYLCLILGALQVFNLHFSTAEQGGQKVIAALKKKKKSKKDKHTCCLLNLFYISGVRLKHPLKLTGLTLLIFLGFELDFSLCSWVNQQGKNQWFLNVLPADVSHISLQEQINDEAYFDHTALRNWKFMKWFSLCYGQIFSSCSIKYF